MNNVKAFDNGGKGKDITSKVTVDGKINTKLPGKYSFTYSVVGGNGVKISKTITVTVKEPPGPKSCEL